MKDPACGGSGEREGLSPHQQYVDGRGGHMYVTT